MQADESTSRAKDLRMKQSPVQIPNRFPRSRCFSIAIITSIQVCHRKISDLWFRSNTGPTDCVRIKGRLWEGLDNFRVARSAQNDRWAGRELKF
jgi:hypothetical protein